jgi:HD-GYP domain-containing protein (c-di-GMP phosphodiesterase class II)
MYKDKLKYGRLMRSQTIEIVLKNINLKYDKEQIHTERVSQYCAAIAREMDFPDAEIEKIKTSAILHDIGKITVPPEILNKPGRLTPE